MTLLLVRHADAGDRAAWTGDDLARPLSATGRRQSEELAEMLAGHDLTRILSSPAKRCVDTVAPVASALGLDVEEDVSLTEGTPFEQVEQLLLDVGSQDVLLCSHADVIGAALTALWRRGHLAHRPNARKVATWLVDGWPDPARVELLNPPEAS
ncbi:MAG: phosphoglycerate mutase family protein [Nitriliruptoraceae bacterium]